MLPPRPYPRLVDLAPLAQYLPPFLLQGVGGVSHLLRGSDALATAWFRRGGPSSVRTVVTVGRFWVPLPSCFLVHVCRELDRSYRERVCERMIFLRVPVTVTQDHRQNIDIVSQSLPRAAQRWPPRTPPAACAPARTALLPRLATEAHVPTRSDSASPVAELHVSGVMGVFHACLGLLVWQVTLDDFHTLTHFYIPE